jgi:hypothetical protein
MLAAKVASNVGLLVTADHGVVDVAQANHVYLDDMAYLDDQLMGVSGDPRAPYLYLKDSDTLPEISSLLSESFGESAAVVTPAELVELHYWSASILEDRDVLPDLVILALENIAIYHRGFAKPASLRVIGQHGSITEQETKVPTLRLGAYSSSLLVP